MKTNLKFFLILLFIGYIMEGRYSTFLHWRMIKRKKICLLTILSVHMRYASGSNKAGSAVWPDLCSNYSPRPLLLLSRLRVIVSRQRGGVTPPLLTAHPPRVCSTSSQSEENNESLWPMGSRGDVIIWVASETVGIASSGSGSGAWDWPQSAHGGKLPTYTII